MAEYLVKPEEVFDMYSEALRILDENTVKYSARRREYGT